MRVVIGSPGNGAALKDAIKEFLQSDGRVSEVVDLSEADISYPEVSFRAAHAVVDGTADRAVLVCGTGVGTAIAASKVKGARAATAHDLVTVRGAVENYDAQILCMGQNVIAPAYARILVDLWLDLRHDPSGFYGPKVREIAEFESRA
ncbi:RpiB/LacA/LacB family sugar-phosphate isomerase [Ornithinimicrobium ciconiae]|uniref:RpiB/LacA/LacB family sugar-phosphate isomerase n=1 Tax=Ornithinimicrobium ciconiae TaxID=2594265 RepID=A0A516G8K7_9MICO|nr:RpiB/LacA/LacB family sugar-phosphate isomerase [Ornithinimicrobium ciconiae]QDO87861.1 RpiB/LacA/LacB family sugar-phosphate isomerase [Ornithinimicrobium ciconiae]